jgi:hypothetical protein
VIRARLRWSGGSAPGGGGHVEHAGGRLLRQAELFEHGGRVVGLVTVLGFALSAALSAVE